MPRMYQNAVPIMYNQFGFMIKVDCFGNVFCVWLLSFVESAESDIF
jgi:hypothetical protein